MRVTREPDGSLEYGYDDFHGFANCVRSTGAFDADHDSGGGDEPPADNLGASGCVLLWWTWVAGATARAATHLDCLTRRNDEQKITLDWGGADCWWDSLLAAANSSTA